MYEGKEERFVHVPEFIYIFFSITFSVSQEEILFALVNCFLPESVVTP